MLINQAGIFKCRIVDHGLAKSSGGWPQWVAQFEAVEGYNKEEDVWIDWAGEEENEIKGYFVLIGKSGETLGVKQIMAATGWDGVSFIELAAMDLSEVIVQTRIEPNTYKEKTTLQISWMDHEAAVPGGSVQKLDADGVKKLQAEFGNLLTNSGIVKAAGAPPKGKPKAPPVASSPAPGVVTKTSKAARIAAAKKAAGLETADAPGPEAGGTLTFAGMTIADMPQTAGVPEDKVEADAPAMPPDDQDLAERPDLPAKKCTSKEAWEIVVEYSREDVSDEDRAKAWQTGKGTIDKKGIKDYTE
ncbi:hypothetical protein LCGC14_1771880, partial [marine sediment metagenome]